MKKFLLSIALFSFAAMKADVALEVTLKEGDNQAASHTVVLSETTNDVTVTLGETSYKVANVVHSKDDQSALMVSFEFIKVVDGVETVLAQPHVQVPGVLSLEVDAFALTFAVSEVEDSAQEVSATEIQE